MTIIDEAERMGKRLREYKETPYWKVVFENRHIRVSEKGRVCNVTYMAQSQEQHELFIKFKKDLAAVSAATDI